MGRTQGAHQKERRKSPVVQVEILALKGHASWILPTILPQMLFPSLQTCDLKSTIAIGRIREAEKLREMKI